MDEISYWCYRNNDITRLHELIAAGHSWALVPCIKEKCDCWSDGPAYCIHLERFGKYRRVQEILLITGITIRETGEPGKGARFEMTVPKGVYRYIGTGQE